MVFLTLSSRATSSSNVDLGSKVAGALPGRTTGSTRRGFGDVLVGAELIQSPVNLEAFATEAAAFTFTRGPGPTPDLME